jgi:hypothetical protein
VQDTKAKRCLHCHEPFPSTRDTRAIFCSHTCYGTDLAKRLALKRQAKPQGEPKLCPHCSKAFPQGRCLHAIHCSPKCSKGAKEKLKILKAQAKDQARKLTSIAQSAFRRRKGRRSPFAL